MYTVYGGTTFLFNNTQLVEFSHFISLKLSFLILSSTSTKVLFLLDLPESLSLHQFPLYLKVIQTSIICLPI